MSKLSKQVEYDHILKESEYKERKPVNRWFFNYCRRYKALCERVKGGAVVDTRAD